MTMRRRPAALATLATLATLAAIALVSGAACGPAGTCTADGAICVADAYVVRPAGDAPTAVFATISNRGAATDTLLGLSAPGYGQAMLHATRDGVMGIVDAVPLPADSVVRLRPGGLHGMVEGPRRALGAGDRVALELRFARAGALGVSARTIEYVDVDRLLGP